MRPSNRFRYSLRAMVDLTLHQATGPVTVAAVAKRQGIPSHYLEQLFNRLRRSGLLVAERGPRGGYRLKLPPNQIPVSAIFQSLELKKSPSLSDSATPDPTGAVWQQVETAVKTTLQATTLETLAAQVGRQVPSPIRHPFTFHI